MRNRILALGALALLSAGIFAATIGTLSQLPDTAGGVFTGADATQIGVNTTTTNTNFTNVNAALALMVPVSSFADCATTAACPSTVRGALHVVQGIGLLATGSPSTYAVTTISPAFTSATSYNCVAQDVTTVANNIGVLTAGYVSGSAVTFNGPNTNTDTFRFTCTGF